MIIASPWIVPSLVFLLEKFLATGKEGIAELTDVNGLAELAEFAEEFRMNGKEGIAKLTGVLNWRHAFHMCHLERILECIPYI